MPICLLAPLLALAGVSAATTASVPDPVVTFSTPGSKTVTLTACNSRGCSSVTKSITVLDPRPKIAALLGPTVLGTAQPPTIYTASTSGKPPLISNWTLTLPSGTQQTGSSPSFAVSSLYPGPQTLALRLSNLTGSASASLNLQVLPSLLADVPPDHWAASFINTFYSLGFTAGCGPDPLSGFPRFCPSALVTRDQLAVFLGRGLHPPPFLPPNPTGVFADVPPSFWAASWIEQLFHDGITGGCQGPPVRLYCPSATMTRAEMAVLMIAAIHGPHFLPPNPTGIFADVPLSYWAARWIEQLFKDGVTGGCQGPPQRLFCPNNTVTRAEIAVFLGTAFHLTQNPRATSFLARLCSSAACSYPAGLPIAFDVRLAGGIPAAYDYDWNGDGTYDESSIFPLDHVYTTAGTFSPRLRVRLGATMNVITHQPIVILPATGFLAPPVNLSVAATGLIPPTSSDPPGTPFRIAYSVTATPPAGPVRGYAAYVTSGLASTFVGLLPATGGSLLLPPATAGTFRYLSLLAFTNTAKGLGSISVRLP